MRLSEEGNRFETFLVSNSGKVMVAMRMQFSRGFLIYALLSTVLCLISNPIGWAQTASKNRQDERRENERVDKARKELGRTQTELKKLQAELQQKSQAFVTARGAYLQAKKKTDAALEQAQERVGESFGIPAQMQVMRGASLILQDKTKEVHEKLNSNTTYTQIAERLKQAEESLENGLHPTTQVTLGKSQVDELELSIASDKKELRAIEDAAISTDPQAMEARRDLQEAQSKLKEMKSKLSPSRIENDFAYKKAKADSDQALKKMQAASAGLQAAEVALRKKANEAGVDYQAYMRARQSDAADSNRTKQRAKKPSPKKTPPKKHTNSKS
ncbi:MAG: hypothetical protein ACKOOI_07940 [Pirellula sp.]